MGRGPWTLAPVHRYPGSMCHFFLFWQAKGSLANSMLQVCNTYFEGSHKFVRWSPQSSSLLRNGKHQLSAQLKKHPGRLCAHVKGHGGVKASVRYTQRLCNHFGYVARFDIQSYYQSMDHQVLRTLLNTCQVTPFITSLVQEYLSLPDHNNRRAKAWSQEAPCRLFWERSI